MKKTKILAQAIFATSLWGSSAFASINSEIKSLKSEFNNIKNSYDKKISDLENKSTFNSTRSVYNNKFNPSIGVILNGTYSSFSESTSEFAGFAVGEEGERGKAQAETRLSWTKQKDRGHAGGASKDKAWARAGREENRWQVLLPSSERSCPVASKRKG